jgi:micrococcal nuclease
MNREYTLLKRCQDQPRRTFQGKKRLAKLISIYDGDTFTIVTRLSPKEPFCEYSIRLSGIDTPEIRHSDPLHKQAGHIVRDVLRDIYPIGTIFLVQFEHEDKYGRLLGTLWTCKKTWFRSIRPDRNICQWLVDQNLAVLYDGGTKANFSKEFLDNVCKYKKTDCQITEITNL